MRIVMLGNRLSLLSGHSRVAWQMARWLEEHGHSARIVTTGDKANLTERHERLIEDEGYRKLYDGQVEFGQGELNPSNRALRPKLDVVLKGADIVHVFDMRALRAVHKIYDGRAPAKIALQVSSLPNMTLRHLRDAGPSTLLSVMTRMSHFTSAIVPCWYVRGLLRMADTLICTSDFLSDVMERTYKVNKSSCHTVPLGVEMQSTSAAQTDHVDFVYFGAPGAYRGTLDAAEAFARFVERHRSSECLLSTFAVKQRIGEDIWVINRVKNRYVPRGVRFQDFIPDIRQRIVGAKAAVLPFRSPFGYAQLPLVVLEALAAGVPVISTNVGSVREMITEGENGFLVDRGDIDAICDRMDLLWRDKSAHESMSAAAKKTVKDRYLLSDSLQRMFEVYERMKNG